MESYADRIRAALADCQAGEPLRRTRPNTGDPKYADF